MTEEEIKEKFPDLENATMECSECLATVELGFDEIDWKLERVSAF